MRRFVLLTLLAAIPACSDGVTNSDAGVDGGLDAAIACFVPECHTGCCDGPGGAHYCCGTNRCDPITFECVCGDGPACAGPDLQCCSPGVGSARSCELTCPPGGG